ncbi:probable N-acetyltransferase 16 isoform X2 [Xenopus laevis]|uniref:Histidine N-acetyltransferase C-terminal domain-containing protein n=2 Tax=Xenopus laevis TaxID=8355 RepID=A0A974HUC5_XENLA|nr:probable N-acetyltransferase 16 isoform X2 [Xenopus laevis]OCT90560.1 hypothetical protein XELAEV_18019176mg [Xenopus laevis]
MSEDFLLDVQIVPATSHDYDEVMSISGGIDCGLDYLPVSYHKWLADPQRRMFLAKFKKQVVGFVSLLVVDGGEAAVAQKLRVALWMRGRGIVRLIQKHLSDTLCPRYREVTKVRLATSEHVPPTKLSKYQLIHSKVVVSVILPHDQLDHAVKLLKHRVQSAYGKQPLDALTPEEVLSLFENSRTAERLLPKGLLIQGWLPLSTHKSNLELLIQRGIVWFHSEHCEKTSDCESTTKSGDTSVTISSGFLSLGTPPISVPLGDGMHRFDIDLFGTDPVSAKKHILHQLIKGVQLLPLGAGVVCIFYAETSLHDELTNFCQGLTKFHFYKEQNVLEQDIKVLARH